MFVELYIELKQRHLSQLWFFFRTVTFRQLHQCFSVFVWSQLSAVKLKEVQFEFWNILADVFPDQDFSSSLDGL